MAEIKYEIVKHLGVLSQNAKDWTKEINLVRWNDRAAKYDIRDWSPDHESMSKGITLSEDEMEKLIKIISTYDK